MNFDPSTKIAAIIGNPVAHSLSPTIHNAVFKSLSINWCYLAFLVETGKVRQALEAMRRLGIAGYSVTMPHKGDVAQIVGEIGQVDEVVRLTESANTVLLREGDEIFATNTDGQGACNAIESSSSQRIANSRAIVIGAGGTARAVVHALIQNGASDVVIFNRSRNRAESIADKYENCRVGQDMKTEFENAQIVINATPIGFSAAGAQMAGGGESPVDDNLIDARHTVLDAVYSPLETKFLADAKRSGAIAVDGLEMLVHQAALQQEVWLGKRGDTRLMRNVALNFVVQESR